MNRQEVCHQTVFPLPLLSYLQVLSIKGQGAADQCVENDPQAPDVHLGPVVLLALKELRGSVGGAAAECVQLISHGKLIAETKVCYLNVHICI